MKLLIQILLLVNVLIVSSCKTFKGNYSTPPNYTGASIEFLNKKELIYHKGTDYGTSSMNYGIYKVEADTMVIEFLKIPKKYKVKSNEKYEIINFEENQQDSIKLEIELEGCWAADIYYKEIKTDSVFWLSAITSDRKTKTTIPSSHLPINLYSSFKKSKVIVPITKSGIYRLKVTLNELLAGLSYNHRVGIISKYAIKKENKEIYFEQVGNEKWGKYYKNRIP